MAVTPTHRAPRPTGRHSLPTSRRLRAVCSAARAPPAAALWLRDHQPPLAAYEQGGALMKALVVASLLTVCLAVPVSGLAQGLPDGSPCMFNRDCLSGKCRGGANKKCQGPPLLPGGAACTKNAQCTSGKCRGGANKIGRASCREWVET